MIADLIGAIEPQRVVRHCARAAVEKRRQT
jgi:hypothetical protein